MDKGKIIAEIKRIASLNKGVPPGIRRFENETGIKKSEWYPELWLRWGDAVDEAGFQSNKLSKKYDKSILIKKYIELIGELAHFPIDGEIRLKRKSDDTFPSDSAFSQLGTKLERAQSIISYCKEFNIGNDIIKYCEDVVLSYKSNISSKNLEKKEIGYVYLIKHGYRNEYKIGKTFNPLRREGEIKLQLHERIKPIHYIETDDPSGIETYWHNRFKNKRKEGEWFSLLAEDVKAFQKWKKIL